MKRLFLILFLLVQTLTFTQAQITNLVASESAKAIVNQGFGSMEQNFEVLADYKGNPFLYTNLLLNLENSAQNVFLKISFDGHNWQNINTLSLNPMQRNSYQNLPLQFNLADLNQLIEKTQEKLYIKVGFESNNQKIEFLPQTLTRQELKKMKKTAESEILALK